jgi:hypothetical protein
LYQARQNSPYVDLRKELGKGLTPEADGLVRYFFRGAQESERRISRHDAEAVETVCRGVNETLVMEGRWSSSKIIDAFVHDKRMSAGKIVTGTHHGPCTIPQLFEDLRKPVRSHSFDRPSYGLALRDGNSDSLVMRSSSP